MEIFSPPDSFLFQIPHAVGLAGAVVYLTAYLILQIGWIRGQGYIYPSMNLLAAMMVLYSLQTDFNLAAVVIQVSFLTISVIGLFRNWLGFYLLNPSADERAFLASKFPELHGRRAQQLLRSGTWERLPAGTRLTIEGQRSNELTYVARGSIQVTCAGQHLYRYENDILVGEISCMSGAPSTATTIVSDDAYVFRIDCEKLRVLAWRDSEFRLSIEAGFSRDIRNKILQKNAAFANHLTGWSANTIHTDSMTFGLQRPSIVSDRRNSR